MEVARDTSHGTVGAGLRSLCQVHTVEPSYLPDFRVYKYSIERKRQVSAWTLAQTGFYSPSRTDTLRKGSLHAVLGDWNEALVGECSPHSHKVLTLIPSTT